jgi:hypothetical protein
MPPEDIQDLRTRSGPRDQDHLRHREFVLRRDAGVCHLCGEPGAWTVDHFIPWKYGGTNHVDNLRAAHGNCNSSKGAALPDGWEKSPEHLWEPGFGPRHVEDLRRERQAREREARTRAMADERERAKSELRSLLRQLKMLHAEKIANVPDTEPPSAHAKRIRAATASVALVSGWGFLILTGFLALIWLSSPSWLLFVAGLGTLGLAGFAASIYERQRAEPPAEIRRQRAVADAQAMEKRVKAMEEAQARANDFLDLADGLSCNHGTIRQFRGGLAENSTTGLEWAGMFCQGQTKCSAVWFTVIPPGHTYTRKPSRAPYRSRPYRYRRF